MALDHAQIIALFKEMYLFAGLDDADLNRASSLFTQIECQPDITLIVAGKHADGFYIIGDGEVTLNYLQRGNNDLIDILVPGDFFGVESLITRHPSQSTATTTSTATLLKAEPYQFNELLVQYPDFRVNMERIVQSQELIRTHNFPWLNEDEVVYQARRKHEAFLLVTLLWPAIMVLIVLIIALAGALILPPNTVIQISFLVAMGVLILAGVLWAVWNWIDWSNDYYVVTNQRVVWIERVIWLYESQVEAPHSTIQAVNVNTSFLGRTLGYGTVTVSTYTGKVQLINVGEPYLMSSLIQEQWHRAQRYQQQSQKADLERSIRKVTHPEEAGTQPQVKKVAVTPDSIGDYQEPSLARNYLGNIFEMRFEEKGVITYRKHWIMLLRRAWKPTLALVMIIAGLFGCSFLYYVQNVRVVPPVLVIGVGVLLIVVLVLPWWLYNYVDWRNDIYQLTDQNIFDIERKPFGTENRKSASLERILSLEHERPGFIGYLLNVGNVQVNFGDAKLTFDGVYEPARVQQEIFSRMHQLRLKQQQQEVARERERILALLEVYHRQTNESED